MISDRYEYCCRLTDPKKDTVIPNCTTLMTCNNASDMCYAGRAYDDRGIRYASSISQSHTSIIVRKTDVIGAGLNTFLEHEISDALGKFSGILHPKDYEWGLTLWVGSHGQLQISKTLSTRFSTFVTDLMLYDRTLKWMCLNTVADIRVHWLHDTELNDEDTVVSRLTTISLFNDNTLRFYTCDISVSIYRQNVIGIKRVSEYIYLCKSRCIDIESCACVDTDIVCARVRGIKAESDDIWLVDVTSGLLKTMTIPDHLTLAGLIRTD